MIGLQFEASRVRLGVLGGTAEAKAIGRSMKVLAETDELPFSGDSELLMPPSFWAWLHPVPRTPLSLLYCFDAETVTVKSLRRLSVDVS